MLTGEVGSRDAGDQSLGPVTLAAEVTRLIDQLAQVGVADRVGLELIRERAAEVLGGLTDQAAVFRKPGLADSYGGSRPGKDRVTRYRTCLQAVETDIARNPHVWSERLRARDGRTKQRADPVRGVNLERLRLVENLRSYFEIARGFFAPDPFFGQVDAQHPEGWRFLRAAGEQLKPLVSPYAREFDQLLVKPGDSVAMRDEAFRLLTAAFDELAAEVYTLPKSRPAHLLDRLDVIMTDANEVGALIVNCTNKSERLRYLFQNLIDELRNACNNGRSQLTPGARTTTSAVLDHLVEMAMKFNAMPFAERERGKVFNEALKLYGEIPALLEQVGEEFSLMRAEERKAARAHTITVVGDVTNSRLHAGDSVATQTIGPSLSEILDLIAQLRAAVTELPEASRAEAIEVIDGIEHQAKSPKPSRGIIRSFLESLRKTAETGNEVAGFAEKAIPVLAKLGPYLLALAAAS